MNLEELLKLRDLLLAQNQDLKKSIEIIELNGDRSSGLIEQHSLSNIYGADTGHRRTISQEVDQRRTLADQLRLKLDGLPKVTIDYDKLVNGTQLSPRSVRSEPCSKRKKTDRNAEGLFQQSQSGGPTAEENKNVTPGRNAL